MANRFLIGVTYYPEHWAPENYPRDLDRIAAAGMNVVRLGEGAWWYWEPREGSYQFELFDRVIDLCRERGIQVIMGTPTYTGPAWIAHRYPEVLRVNFDRVPMAHGSRQNFNHTSAKFRDLSRRITSALAEHYAGEEQIVAWQLDNEFNNGLDASYAESDRVAFRVWLQAKYVTLDALNDAWGTRFWSQVYDDWAQVDLPAPTCQGQNPHRLLDHSRFVSDSVCTFAKEQAAILRAANSRWQITHNALFGNVNGKDLASHLDFWSHDHYPLFWEHWSDFSQKLIESRSYSFPFAIMEQQAGPGGQMSYLQRTPEPGELRLWTYQSIAHGADKLLWFTWRTCPFGTEQHWHGLIDADGKDSRRLAEAAGTAREIATLPDEFFDAAPMKCVGILRDFDVDVNEKRINTYAGDGRWAWARWASAFARRHVPVDFVWPTDDLSGYRVIVAAHQKIVDDALVAKLTAFVETGGTLVLGAQSGLHDRRLHVHQQTPPGPLAAVAGVEVEDWTTLAKEETRPVRFADGFTVQASAFAERLRPTSAVPLAHWNHPDLLDSGVAMTQHTVGLGRVLYLGGYFDQHNTDALLTEVIRLAGVASVVAAGKSVEVVLRRGATHDYLVSLNHRAGTDWVRDLPREAAALVGPSPEEGVLMLRPYGVSVLRVAGRWARSPVDED